MCEKKKFRKKPHSEPWKLFLSSFRSESRGGGRKKWQKNSGSSNPFSFWWMIQTKKQPFKTQNSTERNERLLFCLPHPSEKERRGKRTQKISWSQGRNASWCIRRHFPAMEEFLSNSEPSTDCSFQIQREKTSRRISPRRALRKTPPSKSRSTACCNSPE